MAVKSRVLVAVAVVGLLFGQEAVAREAVEEKKASPNTLESYQELLGKERGAKVYEFLKEQEKEEKEKPMEAHKSDTLEAYQEAMGKELGTKVYEMKEEQEKQAKEKEMVAESPNTLDAYQKSMGTEMGRMVYEFMKEQEKKEKADPAPAA